MPKPSGHEVVLPPAAIEHMSPTAREHAADHLQENFTPAGDPGVYIENGIYGTGWYHYGTSGDDTFIGHDEAADI